jgi:hypothetical protein
MLLAATARSPSTPVSLPKARPGGPRLEVGPLWLRGPAGTGHLAVACTTAEGALSLPATSQAVTRYQEVTPLSAATLADVPAVEATSAKAPVLVLL